MWEYLPTFNNKTGTMTYQRKAQSQQTTKLGSVFLCFVTNVAVNIVCGEAI